MFGSTCIVLVVVNVLYPYVRLGLIITVKPCLVILENTFDFKKLLSAKNALLSFHYP